MTEKEYIERDAAYKACETYFSGVCVYDVSASEAINDKGVNENVYTISK